MPDAKNIAMALAACIGLGALLCLAPLMPCGYTGTADGLHAGYGHHSLADIMAKGLEWDTDTVPVPYERYSGAGPYTAAAQGWAIALYIPIFIAIVFLGRMILGGKLTRPSRKSGTLPGQTRQSRKRL